MTRCELVRVGVECVGIHPLVLHIRQILHICGYAHDYINLRMYADLDYFATLENHIHNTLNHGRRTSLIEI